MFASVGQPFNMIDVTRLLPKIVKANPELAAKLAWSRATGEGLRRNAIAVRLQGRILIVSVADALWQKQLESMAGELLFRVNNLLGGAGVDGITFQISPSDIPRGRSLASGTSSERHQANPLPTELMFAAGGIADDDLRARFLRAADNLIARRDSQSDE